MIVSLGRTELFNDAADVLVLVGKWLFWLLFSRQQPEQNLVIMSIAQQKSDYIGSFVYENGSLIYIHTSEGRVVTNSGDYSYEYFLKDHLEDRVLRKCPVDIFNEGPA